VNSAVSRSGLAPARLTPVFVPRVWGTRDLSPLFPDRAQEEEAIGEVWLTGNTCEFATGEFAGRALGDVWPSLPAEWTGTALRGLPRIPLLVKFIFPEDKLSVQVHPDDEYARLHEGAAGGVGKTEMWYVMGAREGAAVRVGFEPGVTRESFEGAIDDGTAEECLSRLPVHSGDAIFVPAGTPHTICPGMVLCEVQQHSDLTYRVFDYNRVGADGKPRQLHIQKALDVLRFGSDVGPGAGLCSPCLTTTSGATKAFYAACRYFATERWDFRDRMSSESSVERFDLLVFLEGCGRIEFAGGNEPFARAEVWLLPAALGAYKLVAESATSVLHTYVPDFDKLTKYLRGAYGLSETDCPQLIHQ
jgi:mannose-6-phosphate isomerase